MADTRRIRVEMLARVEGEGALEIDIEGGAVESVRLSIFEPPRLFEAFMRGRAAGEAPDMAARICGICPVAYQMSAVHAIESVFGMQPGPEIRALRRLLYCGEYIESHALHMVMLHAPDFLGYEDGIAMAAAHGDLVVRALAAKKAGNTLMSVVGGREIHPINVRLGGFYRLPTRAELTAMQPSLAQARDDSVAILRWAAGFTFPNVERDWEMVALRHPTEYPLNEGRIASTAGIDIAPDEFETVFEERHVAHSNALQGMVRARGAYLTGPLARYALNYDRLPAHIQALAREVGLGPVCRNPYRSIPGTRHRDHLRLRGGAPHHRHLPPAARRGGCPLRRGPEPAPGPPRRRAACCGTVMSSRRTAPSAPSASCRRPPRTSPPSRPTCSTSPPATSTIPTMCCNWPARRRCATTTRAFPALPIS